MVRRRRRRTTSFLKPVAGARPGPRALSENRRDVRRDRDVTLDHRDMVSNAEHEAGRLRVFCDEAGNLRVIVHETVKARMRVMEAGRGASPRGRRVCFCNF